MSSGTVVDVQEVFAGSELVANTAIGAGSLTVVDPTDFTTDGGSILVDAEAISYSTLDEVTGIVTLVGTLAVAHLAGDRVSIVPTSVERYAHVAIEDQEEVLEARVPHALYDRLPVGLRDEALSEMELVELARSSEGDLVVGDVIGREPNVDGSFIDVTTLPPTPTDGSPPASSPTPTVQGGIGALQVKWTAITNADAVVYEVYVSTASGFTPGPTTFAGQTGGTLLVAHVLPATGAALDPLVTYFVKLIARDADGAAAAGTEASGSPRTADVDDLAVGSVETDTLAANAITADKLEAVLAIITTILAGTPDAGRVEVGINPDDPFDLGIRAYDSANAPTLRVDGQDGSVYIRGRLDFGTMSRLLADDIIELAEQPSTGFQIPNRVQRGSGTNNGGGSDIGSMNCGWPAPTTKGNLLLCVVTQINSGGGGTPSTPTISGWTQVQTNTRGSGPIMRQTIFKIENAAAAHSGNESIGFGGAGTSNTRIGIAQVFEYSGVDVQDVLPASTNGGGSGGTTGASGTLAQAGEVVFAVLSSEGSIDAWASTFAVAGNIAATHIAGTPPHQVVDLEQNVGEFITTATGTVTGTATTNGIGYIGMLVSFKAKALGVAAPTAGTVRLYMSDDGGGKAVAHVQDEAGTANSLLMAPAGDGWRSELVTVSVNIPSTAGSAGGAIAVTIGGLAVGDIAIFAGVATNDAQQFHFRTRAVCTVAGQISLDYFNADTVTRDPAAANFYFLVFHRS